MKKAIYSSIAVLAVAGLIIYGFLSAPRVIQIDRQLEVVAYKLKDNSFSRPVQITLKGVFDEKTESYLGNMTINEEVYTNCRLTPEFALMMCTVGDSFPQDILGMVYADKDFKAWSLSIEASYNSGRTGNSLYTILNQGDSSEAEDSIILSTAASGRDASLTMHEHLWQSWGEAQARKVK